MANPRQNNKPARNAGHEARRTTERATEQTRRIGETTIKAGDEISRAGADLLQQNAELLQKSWTFGADLAADLITRSSEYLGRSLGVSGDEARKATDRSAHNAETILYSATTIAKGMNGVSREYFDFLRHQFQKNMERMHELRRCRSPQDVAAIQTDLMRETVGELFECNRRIADMSLRLADDAGSHIAESMETTRRAA
jgi:hypothetical protein